MRVWRFTRPWRDRARWALMALLVAGGLLFAYVAWQQASRYERTHTAALFSRHLSDRAVMLDRALRDVSSELTRAAGLLALNPSMSRAEFRVLASDTLDTHRFVQGLHWAPVVTDATQRYAPVSFVEPLEQNRDVLGFDLLSDPGSRAALTDAGTRRTVVFTGFVDVVPGSGRRQSILAVAPVFLASNRQDGRGDVGGFVVAALGGDDLLRDLSTRGGGEASPRARFELADETGPPQVLARSPAWDSRLDSTELWSHRFEVGTRRWRLSGQPTAVFFTEHGSREPLVLGAAAFALWASVSLLALALVSVAQREARHEQDKFVWTALDSATDGIVVADTGRRCLFMNDAAERVLGPHQPGEVLRVPNCLSTDGVTPIGPDELPLARVLRDEPARGLEVHVRRPGETTGWWLSVNAAPVKDDSGRICGGVTTFRDITARREAETAARQSNRLLEEMKYALDEATIVSLTDADCTIRYVNDKFCEVSGYSREELIGANHRICNSGYHPPEFFQDLWATIRAGRTWRGTICNRAKNGTEFWVDTTIVPLAEGDDGPRYLAIRTDVSDRVRQEASLRQLSNAIEQTADSIFITDRDGVIEYVNSGFETTTGYSRAEAIGQTPAILKSGRQDTRYYETLWATITAGEVFRSKPIDRKKNGQEYHAEQTITPIHDAAGRITHFVSVMRDVTERIRRQEQDIEMAYAAQVQQRLYPVHPPAFPGIDLGASVCPAAATGGDYVDFLAMPDGRLGIAIGDVSGHGLASALIMAEVRAYLRPLTAIGPDPAAIFDRLSQWLYGDLAEGGQYVTMVLLSLTRAADRLEYANAGHVPGCVIGRQGVVRDVFSPTGLPLGLFPETRYEAARGIPLQPGDIIVLLTDGITEAEDRDGQPFGLDAAIDMIRHHRDEPARDIARHVSDAVRQFASGSTLSDDITIVICKIAADASAADTDEAAQRGCALPEPEGPHSSMSA